MESPAIDASGPAEVGAAAARASNWWAPLAWAAAYLAVAAVVQFYFVSIPYDADTAYHVAVGRLIREHGILRTFPWTPFSWLADHYADKELLFHLLFVPLAGLSWITAAKIVGTLLGGALLFALYLVLRAEKVRLAGLWAFVPLAATDVFLFRFALVRPHLLSIALAVIVLWAAARGRLAILALASALYPWSYVAWPLPIVLVGVAEAARLLSGERLRWKPAVIASTAVALGVALHPNARELLRFTWIQIVEVLFRNAWGARRGFELGQEFEPFSAAQWAQWLLACVAMAGAAAALAWRARKATPVPLAFAIAALAFGLMTVKTARFAEYFVPLSVAALAIAWRPLRWPRVVPVAVLGVCILYSGSAAAETLHGLGTRDERIPPSLASWLQERIPPGSQVFTCEWGHTGTLMLALPERRFIVALDPTFFYMKDPELYRLWYELPRKGPPGSADLIRKRFGARYVVCFWDDRFRRFYNQLPFESGVQTLLVGDYWNVYDLGEPSAR